MTPRPSGDPGIGERIRARRLLRGWSLRYAASRAGISHAVTVWAPTHRQGGPAPVLPGTTCVYAPAR